MAKKDNSSVKKGAEPPSLFDNLDLFAALDKPWFFVDRETWKEITEEEFIQSLKDMLKDEK